MAISTDQKVDYLFKKLGFAVTKTDVNSVKSAANESIASPLLLRGDKVWQQSADIPSTIPSSSTSILTVYGSSSPVECTQDITASTNRTWKTSLTDWVPPEFGSTYLVNVYIHTSSDGGNAVNISNKVFITGSGNDDEWFFDYQSGVLHFIGDNLPNGVNFSGKSVYITGARYVGSFGVGSGAGLDANIGNLTISDTTISTATSGDDIILSTVSGGLVEIDNTTGILLPTGTTAERPSTGTYIGVLRYNSTLSIVEFYNGTNWVAAAATTTAIDSQTITGDNSTVTFTLVRETPAAGLLVSINGVIQKPTTAYTTSGTDITFNEAPVDTDVVEIRYLSVGYTSSVANSQTVTGIAYYNTASTIAASSDYTFDPSTSTLDLNGDFDLTGNITLTGNILNGGSTGTGDIGQSGNKFGTVYATTFSGTASEAQYADLAENYLADAEYDVGTVIAVGGDKEVTAANISNQHSVLGVVSSKPAYLMNSELVGGTAIALKGRVIVKVIGPVKKGDRLAPSMVSGLATVKNERDAWSFAVALQTAEGTQNNPALVEAVIL